MSASKVSTAWSWDSLPSFQDLSAAINSPTDMYAKFGESLNIMPEVERVLTDMQNRLTKLQVSADMDSTLQSMKTNIDKLLELLKDASENIKDNNNRLVQATLIIFRDVTKELSQKVKDATSGTHKGKSPREFFTQPQVKSALIMFADQLDWMVKLMEDNMKEKKVSTKSKAPIDEATKKKSWNSRLSFKSKP
eukprot:GFUD01103557.1.p1 GENE.GFUD01103557.1~~GFUD01103557.1.p1  ORF type:complete len:193 (-),score=56.11 GFUD01103557.1:97-675(-)